MKRLLLLLWLAGLLFFCFAPHAIAEDLSAVETVSFNQMPPFDQDGSWPSVGEYVAETGYETARNWVAGEYPVDVLKIGDILDGLHPEAFRLSDLAALDELSIADIGLVADLPLASLLQSVPFSGDWPLEQLPGVAEALSRAVGISVEPAETLNQIISRQAELGELLTGDVFGDLPLMTIPNIELAKISDFEGFQEQSLSSIPGLGDIPLGAFPNPLTLLSFTAQQDIAFGPKEYAGDKPTPKPVSGSIEKGFQVPCVGGCPHIELTGSGWQGDQWMTKDHRIADGHGLLGAIPGMDEAGAYRLPFGETFALQIRSTDEKTGAANWGLAFRVCSSGFFVDLGCTAYALEVPLGITTYEKDTILTGIKDGMGGRSQPIRAPPEWEALRPATPPDVQSVIGRSRSGRNHGGFGLCGEGPGGVDFQSLAVAFSSIEGNYNSVGSYTAGGRGLGRYQYMTYRADVREIIRQKPGGAAFLDKADRGGAISSAEVDQFFPAADQDSLFKADQTRNIEQAISEGFSGSRIIERVGQIHFGGPAAPIDGNASDTHGRLTLKTYGEELAHSYRLAETQTKSDSQCKAQTPVQPLQTHLTGTLSAQEYGAPRGGRQHAGQDLDLGPNDSFQSYIGGEVVNAGYDGGGYYHYIDIYNADLGVVERIAELDKFSVGVGDTIAPGQVVGQGTTTTGVVHLEYRNPVNAQKQGGYGIQGTYDPIEYLEGLGVLQRNGQTLTPVKHGDGHDH